MASPDIREAAMRRSAIDDWDINAGRRWRRVREEVIHKTFPIPKRQPMSEYLSCALRRVATTSCA